MLHKITLNNFKDFNGKEGIHNDLLVLVLVLQKFPIIVPFRCQMIRPRLWHYKVSQIQCSIKIEITIWRLKINEDPTVFHAESISQTFSQLCSLSISLPISGAMPGHFSPEDATTFCPEITPQNKHSKHF